MPETNLLRMAAKAKRREGMANPGPLRRHRVQAFSEQDSSRVTTMGRSSGFRIDLLATPSHEFLRQTFVTLFAARSGYCSVCPRLQRRDRNGFSPFSLFSGLDNTSRPTPTSAHNPILKIRRVNGFFEFLPATFPRGCVSCARLAFFASSTDCRAANGFGAV